MADRGGFGATALATVDWTAAVWAGVISGAVFMVLEMAMVEAFLGMSMWGPPRMIAAMVMGEGVLPPPDTFAPGVMVVAMIAHFMLSILFAAILVLIVQGRGLGTTLAIGAAYGLVLYLVNFYGFTAVFPWFAMARNWVSIVTHVVFGLVAGWAYVVVRQRHSRPLAS